MKIYNTMTRQKEEFKPLEPGAVKLYACGPTVYDFIHIGNARPLIVFDVLRRYLEHRGYRVCFVQNFTDIDDKLINRSREEGISVPELAEKYIAEYFVDAKGLGLKEAQHPRAAENIDAIIDLISTLIAKGYAYEQDGDVYFEVGSFADYGKLSGQPMDELESGARVDVDERKRSPIDFALWKAQKPGEPAWDSPWGSGRPGWHIECSAMAARFLGQTIDIHGGGQDLIFPHHENEVAQSESAHGAPFARYWMHNGYINVNNRKMSKSVGNFFTVRDISKRCDYEVIRLFMLSAHYRSPINFSDELLEQSATALKRLYTCLNSLEFAAQNTPEGDNALMDEIDSLNQKFEDSMDDDLNTADAIAAMFEIVRLVNSRAALNKAEIEYARQALLRLGGVLGLLQKNVRLTLDDEAERLIEERAAARAAKDWARSDQIRDQLKGMGVILEDTPQGVKWRIE